MNYSFSQGKVTSTYNAKNGIVVIGDIIRRRTGLSSDSSHRHISPPPPEIQAAGPVSDTSSPSAEGGTKTSRFKERIGAHWRQELRHRGREAREEIWFLPPFFALRSSSFCFFCGELRSSSVISPAHQSLAGKNQVFSKKKKKLSV